MFPSGAVCGYFVERLMVPAALGSADEGPT